MHPFTTVRGAITAAFVLAIVVSLLITSVVAGGDAIGFNHPQVGRWLISSQAYVDPPAVLLQRSTGARPRGRHCDKGGPGGAGVTKYIAPRPCGGSLGCGHYLGTGAYPAVRLWRLAGVSQGLHLPARLRDDRRRRWLGTIMLFNVWVLIAEPEEDPRIVAATDEEKAKARKVALYASRINFILSVPMLMCMGGQSHGLPF